MRCNPPPTQTKAHLVAGDVKGKLVTQLAPRMQGVHQGGGGGAALGGWRRRMGLRQLLRARRLRGDGRRHSGDGGRDEA